MTFLAGHISGSYNSGTNVLTVSSGSTVVAEIQLAGSYATAEFPFRSGANDTVEITDPAVTPAVTFITTTSATAPTSGCSANYIANFGAEAHGNVLISSTGQTETPQPLIAHPHG